MNHRSSLRVSAALLLLVVCLALWRAAPVCAETADVPTDSGADTVPDLSPPATPLTIDTAALGPRSAPELQSTVEGSWWDGEPQYTAVVNYLGYFEYGYGVWVGYWQNAELGHPLVGETYMVKVSAYGVGSPASGLMSAGMSFALPPSTAIDTRSAVRCFGGPNLASEFYSGCPQTLPYSSGSGTYTIPSGAVGDTWRIDTGSGWEFWIPVVTSAPLTNQALYGAIDNIEAMNEPDWLYPTVPIYVFSGGSTSAPGAFVKSSPANGATGVATNPTLSWGASSGATGYEVCYDTTNDGACASWMSTGTSTSKSLSGLAAGTTYYWQARASNSAGTTYANGSSSAFWSFTTAVPPSAPGAFSKAAPSNGASSVETSPTLSWGSSSGSTRYEYCYDTTNDGACSNSWVSTGMTPSASLSGLATATSYYWQVRAVNSAGPTYADGGGTAYWSFTTAAPFAPPGPFGRLFPANGAVGVPTSLTLYWGVSEGATSYQYCFDTTNDNSCSSWTSVGTNTSASLAGLTPGVRYYWQVRAVNASDTVYADGYSSLYWSFDTAITTSANDTVITIAVQPDGKVLVGGYFTDVNGYGRNRLARLNADGTIDTAFNPNITGGWRVDAIVVQPDGRILVSGDFDYVGGVARNNIARLSANGTLDTTFDPNANGAVYAMALQVDGKVLVGGAFTSIGGGTGNHIARLNPNGSLDASFTGSADDKVGVITVLPDNRILIGGDFKYLNDAAGHAYLARIWWNGTIDDTFQPELDGSVAALVREPNGQILIGGAFTEVNGESHSHIARLTADGTLDGIAFSASADSSIMSLAVQSDGKILIGGYFTTVNGETHNHLVRLKEKGEVDTSLTLSANDLVNVVALQGDGKILVGGAFSQLNGATQARLARVPNNATATQTLWAGATSASGDYVQWMPRLAAPEVARVSFEISLNGVDFVGLGEGVRVGYDWQLLGLALPRNQTLWIRARGYYATGRSNASCSIVEKVVVLEIEERLKLYMPLVLR